MCPICQTLLGWIGDFTCDEVHFCECEEGTVGYWVCMNDDCRAKIQITTDCKGDEL